MSETSNLYSQQTSKEFRQCHFFAGIAVWSYAPVQTSLSSSQPASLSAAVPALPSRRQAKAKGFDDARHLWPDWIRLIRETTPLGRRYLHRQALVGPDIRERLYFVCERLANNSGAGWQQRWSSKKSSHQRAAEWREGQREPERLRNAGGMGNASLSGSWSLDRESKSGRGREEQARGSGISCWMGDSECSRQRSWQHQQSVHSAPIQTRKADRSDYAGKSSRLEYADSERCGEARQPKSRSRIGGSEEHIIHPFADALKGHWRDADWLFCTDGRWRPVDPGTFPLAHGAPARLGRLRGYGDAINAEVAKAFIESYLATGELEP